MKNKPEHIDLNEYKSIRYLNLFRLLLSFFFFSIIFHRFGIFIGFTYTLDIARFIASVYLSVSILVWVASVIFRQHSSLIGLIALAIDLPFIISLTLLFNGVNDGWAILPVITIGSFSMLSRKPYSILLMPLIATLLLWIFPLLLNIDGSQFSASGLLLYSLTYFAIALVGIRQSQNYTQSLLLTQIQKTTITNLSKVNKLIIDQMHSGVIAFDNHYQVILINSKAKELIKVSRKQLLPMKLIKKIIATTENSHKNFSLYGEDILINLIKKDKKTGLNLLFIEEQKQINEKSQQINLASLGQLSATIAHELRNPMASIYSAAQLIQESTSINDEDRQFSEIIIKQVERSNKIIEDILQMSKPHIAYQTTINLKQKIEDFIHEFCTQNDLSDSQVEFEITEESLHIEFDSNHLTQLLWNLSENALRHGEGEFLKIAVSNQAKSILLDFKNKGPTFEPIVEESLFTPFFTTHTQGTGLGLYICREICKSNNAKLEYLRLEFQHVFRVHIAK